MLIKKLGNYEYVENKSFIKRFIKGVLRCLGN